LGASEGRVDRFDYGQGVAFQWNLVGLAAIARLVAPCPKMVYHEEAATLECVTQPAIVIT
jgi:hypothetical protein